MIATNPTLDPAPTDTPLPPLSPADAALLRDFLEGALPLLDLAAAHNRSLPDLLTWAADPAVRAHLDAYAALLQRAEAIASTRARITALHTLTRLAADPATPPLEARRAATTLARATAPQRKAPATSRGTRPDTPPSSDTPPKAPEPREKEMEPPRREDASPRVRPDTRTNPHKTPARQPTPTPAAPAALPNAHTPPSPIRTSHPPPL